MQRLFKAWIPACVGMTVIEVSSQKNHYYGLAEGRKTGVEM